MSHVGHLTPMMVTPRSKALHHLASLGDPLLRNMPRRSTTWSAFGMATTSYVFLHQLMFTDKLLHEVNVDNPWATMAKKYGMELLRVLKHFYYIACEKCGRGNRVAPNVAPADVELMECASSRDASTTLVLEHPAEAPTTTAVGYGGLDGRRPTKQLAALHVAQLPQQRQPQMQPCTQRPQRLLQSSPQQQHLELSAGTGRPNLPPIKVAPWEGRGREAQEAQPPAPSAPAVVL